MLRRRPHAAHWSMGQWVAAWRREYHCRGTRSGKEAAGDTHRQDCGAGPRIIAVACFIGRSVATRAARPTSRPTRWCVREEGGCRQGQCKQGWDGPVFSCGDVPWRVSSSFHSPWRAPMLPSWVARRPPARTTSPRFPHPCPAPPRRWGFAAEAASGRPAGSAVVHRIVPARGPRRRRQAAPASIRRALPLPPSGRSPHAGTAHAAGAGARPCCRRRRAESTAHPASTRRVA